MRLKKRKTNTKTKRYQLLLAEVRLALHEIAARPNSPIERIGPDLWRRK